MSDAAVDGGANPADASTDAPAGVAEAGVEGAVEQVEQRAGSKRRASRLHPEEVLEEIPKEHILKAHISECSKVDYRKNAPEGTKHFDVVRIDAQNLVGEIIKREGDTAEVSVYKDFNEMLREENTRLVLSFLCLSCAIPAWLASKTTRSRLSIMVHVRISFHVVFGVTEVIDKDLIESKRRAERCRNRLPHCPASGPLPVFVWFKVKDMPIRRATFNRTLCRLIPAFLWEECHSLEVISRGNIDALDKLMHGSLVTTLNGSDVLLLQQNHEVFRKLRRLTMTMTVLTGFREDFVLPKVHRLKVLCEDAAFADSIFNRIYSIFPNLTRLHLDLLPAGLLPLCGPGFKAPPDLRMSLTEGSASAERHANVFVASHLFSLPFSWSDTFFMQVQRLQMSELTEDLQGLSLESLVGTLRKLPHLRRLGTVSSKAAVLFDLSSETCMLEELVLVIELEDVKEFFSSMLPLEQQRRRCTLRKLAVHLLCSDGAARLHLDVENAICAGWYNIATSMMWPFGWVTFSMGSPPLRETALGQLPWFMPQHFCLDTVEYEGRQSPVSTPLDRPLTYTGVEGLVQPSGTLVAGILKRSIGGPNEAHPDIDGFDSVAGSLPGSMPPSPSDTSPRLRSSLRPGDMERTGGTSSSRGFGRKTTSGSTTPTKQRPRMTRASTAKLEEPLVPDWLGMSMVDAIEGLLAAFERIRKAYDL